jgi:hypothetical protein
MLKIKISSLKGYLELILIDHVKKTMSRLMITIIIATMTINIDQTELIQHVRMY